MKYLYCASNFFPPFSNLLRNEVKTLEGYATDNNQKDLPFQQPPDAISAIPTSSTPLMSQYSKLDNAHSQQKVLSVWKRRENFVRLSIVSRLCIDKDFLLAIEILKDLIKTCPKDPHVASILGRVYLQMGNVKSALLAFRHAENVIENPATSALAHFNR
jgi:hypothetical protein